MGKDNNEEPQWEPNAGLAASVQLARFGRHAIKKEMMTSIAANGQMIVPSKYLPQFAITDTMQGFPPERKCDRKSQNKYS
jgi:hypothetical protein